MDMKHKTLMYSSLLGRRMRASPTLAHFWAVKGSFPSKLGLYGVLPQQIGPLRGPPPADWAIKGSSPSRLVLPQQIGPFRGPPPADWAIKGSSPSRLGH
eukprot:6287776-Pyramimonas_sp.AAC.1